MGKIVARLMLLGIIAAVAYFIVLDKDRPLPSLDEIGSAITSLDVFGGNGAGEETFSPTLKQDAVATNRAKESSSVAGPSEEDPYRVLKTELAQGFQSRESKFTVTHQGNRNDLSENMKDIIRQALHEDDYTAYVLDSYAYTLRSWGNKSTATIEARYRETAEQTAQVNEKVKSVLAEILKPGMNDHEKIKAIHDWVVTNVEYDQSLTYYTAYHAIALGKAVCQGYSLLGYRMLQEAGFDALIAEGSVNTGEHAWNMVKLDGVWYHLDLTWDDPVGATDDKIRYGYYLKTDDELRRDHSWTLTYPEASTHYGDTLNELARNGTTEEAVRYNALKIELGLHWLEDEHTVSGADELQSLIAAAAKSRTMKLEFRYLDGDGFPDALKEAFRQTGSRLGYRASYEPFAGEKWLLVNLHLEYP